jgi:hypothetical protein
LKIQVTRVEPTTQVSASGKKKYYIYTEDGDRHIAWGDWIADAKGKEVEATVKEESFKGNDYTVIWPAKEASKETSPVASQVDVKARQRLFAEPDEAGIGPTDFRSIEKRDRMMAKESALKSAAQVWSTKVEARIDGAEKDDPMEMAREYYRWILADD